MARNWLFVGGGWEHGPIRRSRSANDLQGRPYVEAGYGDGQGGGGSAPEKSIVGSGYFAFDPASAGLHALADAASGHVFARVKNWVFWCGRAALVGFSGAVTAGDKYVFARCAKYISTTGVPQYLAPGIKIIGTAAPITYQFTILQFNADGSFFGELGSNSATKTVGSTVYDWVLALNTSSSTNNCWLYINGTAGVAVTSGTVQTTGHLLHDNRFAGGKGADASSDFRLDDHCSAEGDSVDDLPPVSLRQILYQPNADISGESQWAGTYCDVDDENDTTVGDGNTDSNVITPSAAGQQEIFAFPDLVSESGQTATVEAVLLIWEQYSATFLGDNVAPAWTSHKPMARLSGEVLQDLSGSYGSGRHQDDLSPYSLWFARLMQTKPLGGAWTAADFNNLQAGLQSIDTYPVGEFYAIALGQYVAMPAANTCAAVGRRRWPGAVI